MNNNPKTVSVYQKNRLLLHASAVNVADKALLFLGHSTSGKSTISQLLSKKYPIIADDKVWIDQKANGEWFVHDGESLNFSETNPPVKINSDKEYQLHSVLRIFKSNKPSIKTLSAIETCRYLINAVFEIDIQRKQTDLKVIKKWFSHVAEISRKIGGWHLTFKKDVSIINLIGKTF